LLARAHREAKELRPEVARALVARRERDRGTAPLAKRGGPIARRRTVAERGAVVIEKTSIGKPRVVAIGADDRGGGRIAARDHTPGEERRDDCDPGDDEEHSRSIRSNE
jgi:hypothetical protein